MYVLADSRLALWPARKHPTSGLYMARYFDFCAGHRVCYSDVQRHLVWSGQRGRRRSCGHGGLRNLLVVAEVALSLVLLVGAGALMRSFLSMMNLDLGFNPHNIVSLRPRIPNATPVQQRHFVEAATSRLGSCLALLARPRPRDFLPTAGSGLNLTLWARLIGSSGGECLKRAMNDISAQSGFDFSAADPFHKAMWQTAANSLW